MSHRIAVIDLGTNTFQLLIAEQHEQTYRIIHEEYRAAQIGKAGISQGVIAGEGIERALNVLRYFREVTNGFGVATKDIMAAGTSAIRNAKNSGEFIQKVWDETQIKIEVISGEAEAALIYKGVKFGTDLGHSVSMIMDIGGGSIEFILCNQQRIFWKQSFEIGGQRLMDKFMTTDPILPVSVKKMYDYLDEQLLPLTNAIHQYAPETLLGSAGSFETLLDMYYAHNFGHSPDSQHVIFDLPIDEFYRSYRQLLSLNHDDRMALPGMIELRVDMIVVGVCLIDFVLKKYEIGQMKVTYYALKEGLLSRLANSIC